MLSQNPFDDHSKLIVDIVPDMVEKCPMAITKYFEARELKAPWGLSLTRGNLKLADPTVNFGVFTYPMEYIRNCEL